MTARGEWEVDWDTLRPRVFDLTSRGLRQDDDFMCLAMSTPSFCLCTRRRGHGGRHAAGDGTRIVAVWNQSGGES